jgi:hypothetical protein
LTAENAKNAEEKAKRWGQKDESKVMGFYGETE